MLDYIRARTYRPDLGRFHQRDPNEQALILFDALAMNGETRRAFASLVPEAQYNDGLHLYQFVGSNPVGGRDPSGLFTLPSLLGGASLRSYLRTAGLISVGAAGFMAANDAMNAGIAAYGQGQSPRRIILQMLSAGGSSLSTPERIAASLVFGGIAAAGPIGAAVAGGTMYGLGLLGMADAGERIHEAQDPIELAQAATDGMFSFGAAWLGPRLLARAIPRGPARMWHRGTFRTAEESLRFHWAKHAQKHGKTPEQYTKDALDLWTKNSHKTKEHRLRDGRQGKKIKEKPGGIYTENEKIVSFWYD